MKPILAVFDKLARRVATDRNVSALERREVSYDFKAVAEFQAAWESAEFYTQHLLTAKVFADPLDLLSYGISIANPEGLFLEFGVASGRTIRHIARARDGRPVYGFDTFKGLPEDWRAGFAKGTFAVSRPEVPANVVLLEGEFGQTLPGFVREHPEHVSFIHVDCDLYSSTKTIFDILGGRIESGCTIVFDEYLNYPGWKFHEHKAFEELVSARQLKVRYEACVPSLHQICVVID